MEKTTRYKLCPGCGKLTEEETSACDACGHQYRTDFKQANGASAEPLIYKVIGSDGRESGPTTEQTLLDLAHRGDIVPATRIYDYQEARWLAADEHPALRTIFHNRNKPPARSATTLSPPGQTESRRVAPASTFIGLKAIPWIVGVVLLVIAVSRFLAAGDPAEALAPVGQRQNLVQQIGLEEVRRVDGTTPQGVPCQRMIVRWRNFGPQPIRYLSVDIEAQDADGRPFPLNLADQRIYSVEDSQPGVVAGQVYQTPHDQGYVLDKQRVPPDIVLSVDLRRAYAKSGVGKTP